MEPDPAAEYLIDDAGDVGAGSDGELQCAIESLCGMSPSSGRKACREKMRRDKLNDRFSELSSVLDPGRPPKSDKATILSDAARAEKNELRDEKIKLKTDKEILEQQLKAMNMAPAGYMPHPMVFHPAIFAPQGQTPATKSSSSPAFPSVPMWRWLPPSLVDTTKDAKLWPPNA
ncbi:Myc-type basic helix-loop-helix (bHLH) domain-containing protein [Dioscorea alata]|uniref:Myc-type basic helix-loop-helix (BHLH) domain-containing protein n=1 Tax=Dioscorea alata TaxID=55571 RepID=A0ACB7V6V7_DIOAL|nr:Myc-type basic helix-loop-helix (bHLH) domain-containing protein [Dioscorea alata]